MQNDEAGLPQVLVVDDNPAKLYVIAQILRAGGFAVTEASCGADGLTLAEMQPDVIVLDVDLPDIGGFEVCRRIKAGAATSRIPVLHISGKFIGGGDKAGGLEGGADGYLTEPVEPRELRAAVAAMLRSMASSPSTSGETSRRSIPPQCASSATSPKRSPARTSTC